MGTDFGIPGPRPRGHVVTAAEFNAITAALRAALNLTGVAPVEVRHTGGGLVVALKERTPPIAWGLVRAVRVAGAAPSGPAAVADIRVDGTGYGQTQEEDLSFLDAPLIATAALTTEVDVHPPVPGDLCVLVREPLADGTFSVKVWCPTAVVVFEECEPQAAASALALAAAEARIARLEARLAELEAKTA